jgi:hypothetical protein
VNLLVPWQRACIDRVNGSIQRECLDHVLVFDESSQSASRVKLIHGLSSASKVEDPWTTRRAQHTANRSRFH